jgi:CBS domain-containing protein
VQIRDIMTRDVEVIDLNTPLIEAARKMKTLGVGLMPVRDGQVLAGMLTDRDITLRAVADGRDPRSTTVKEVMSPGVIYCLDDQDVREAASIMEDKQIRRLPVLNAEQRLVGIVSLGDLAVRTKDEPLAGAVLGQISK